MLGKKSGKGIIAIVLAAAMLSGCALGRQPDKAGEGVSVEQTGGDFSAGQGGEDAPIGQDGEEAPAGQEGDIFPGAGTGQGADLTGARPMLINTANRRTVSADAPSVEMYSIAPDLGNIDNLWQFYLTDGVADKLARNGFVVCGNAGSEFFGIYEENRYGMIPGFVTVDSMMHTYHLYFSHLMKNTEKNYLSDRLMQLSRKMLEDSISQYEQLKGSEWESAAKRNVAFFTIGARLQDDTVAVGDYVEDMVQRELDSISRGEGIQISGITGDEEDYTQYAPRGYYEGDGQLEQYFRAMMWYGRIHFRQEDEDLDRSALLMAQALSCDGEAYGLWESIYAVTSFFAGASDDLGVCEYAPILKEIYGEGLSAGDLIGREDAFGQFHKRTAALSAPAINSIPIKEGEDNVILGFRFMGQRFTIDGAIMQKLIFSNVGQNSMGARRMLPDVLDVPAALGSDVALGILEEMGAADYAGYSENMAGLKAGLSQENDTLWSASLYAGWLNTLRPLLTPKGEGWPMFMRGEEWLKKDLECFAGSFAELKHDTILYSKQVLAEMGGGMEEEPDDRGYVEPEPLVYARFADLADLTSQGLKGYGMLDSADWENLSRLSYMAQMLLEISEKELQDEVLTDEEYEFIKAYGGNIEHFWYETVKGISEDGYVASVECPAAIVADIATDPAGGQVLEVGTGNPSVIYVVVKVDGKLKIARGSVYSFYQFPWPMEDRLTDSKWRQMMGIQSDEYGYYTLDKPVERPEWTDSYRYRYEWE